MHSIFSSIKPQHASRLASRLASRIPVNSPSNMLRLSAHIEGSQLQLATNSATLGPASTQGLLRGQYWTSSPLHSQSHQKNAGSSVDGGSVLSTPSHSPAHNDNEVHPHPGGGSSQHKPASNHDASNFDSEAAEEGKKRSQTRFVVYNIDWSRKREVFMAFKEFGECDTFQPNFEVSSPEKEKGRLYIQFNSPESAAMALRELQLVKFGERHIRIVPFGKKELNNLDKIRGNRFEPSIKGKPTLVVKMLPYTMEEEAMKLFFSQWGTVLETIVARSANGMHRGYGMVVFEDMDAYNATLELAEGLELERGIRLRLEPYSEEKRREKYQELRKKGAAKVSNRQIDL